MYFGNVVDDLFDHHFRLLRRLLISANHQNTLRVSGNLVFKVDTSTTLRLNLINEFKLERINFLNSRVPFGTEIRPKQKLIVIIVDIGIFAIPIVVDITFIV